MVLNIPDAYLDEYCYHIYDLFKLKVTKDQLSRFFKREGISRKKVWHHPSRTHICSCRKKHGSAILCYAAGG